MIVVVSDLHLQHTSLDRIRWNAPAGGTRELDVRRNVSAGPLHMMLSMVSRNARRVEAGEIHIVFAGDIFEIYRSPRWFLGGRAQRPTQYPAGDLRPLVERILADIESDCGDFFDALDHAVNQRPLRFRGEEFALPVPPTIHYLPGNHDRLVNSFPSTRRTARRLLRMGESEARFPHVFQPPSGYGILIRHGHEYDRYNFSADFGGVTPGDDTYDRPTFGDYVTVDIATRLAVAFRAHYAQQLRAADDHGDLYRSVYAALTEFDDVRPATAIIEYLATLVRGQDEMVIQMLRPVLLDVFETARSDAFFASEADRLGLGKYFRGPVAELFEEALKSLSADRLADLVELIVRLQSDGAGPAESACREEAVVDGEVDIVIAGHTHRPAHTSIPATHSRTRLGEGMLGAYQGMFLDTGTWRTRIDEGVGGTFGRVRAYTMVQCYHDDELRNRSEVEPERRRFETWTGHLASDAYGPSVSDVVVDPRPRPQQVRLLSCEIQHVDEGETRNGAELELHLGVDASATVFRRDGVHDGDTVEIGVDLTVDPGLDGEVWCWGIERDLGRLIFDRDDALPWAVDILPREGGQFVTGRRRLRVSNSRGSCFFVNYVVRALD